jgi:HlyD family secretion protein
MTDQLLTILVCLFAAVTAASTSLIGRTTLNPAWTPRRGAGRQQSSLRHRVTVPTRAALRTTASDRNRSGAACLRWAAMSLLIAASSAGCGARADPAAVELNGRIEAPLVDLAPKVSGRVTWVGVKEGDRVKAGDLLIRLDLGETALAVERSRHGVESARARLQDLSLGSRQPEIAAAEAEVADRRAALDLATRDVQRQEFLLARQVATQRDYDHAKTEADRARATLRVSEERLELARDGFRRWQTEQARSEMERARTELRQSEVVARESEIRAPADGIVTHRMVEPGQLLAAGQTGMTLALASRLYVRTFIPETQLGRVRPGQPAVVRVDAHAGQSFAATVAEISPDPEFTPKPVETRAERVTLVYAAKVDLTLGWNAPLVPGQPAEVSVLAATPSSQALANPGAPR